MSPMRRGSRFVLLVALLAMLSSSTRSQQTLARRRAQAKNLPSQRLTIVGLPNFSKVTPRLYRGGQPTPVGFRKLASMGVDIVVDLRLSGKDRERQEVEDLGMRFVSIPWHCLLPRDEIFRSFLGLVRANRKKKIFVHCRYGDDRTGMVVAAYRMGLEGWTTAEARQEMNQFGFHPLLCPSLVQYERNFPGLLKREADLDKVEAVSGPVEK